MLRPLYLLCFRIFGWKITGSFPDLKKYVMAIGPHTSNLDFLIGVSVRSILRMENATFLGKSQLFKPPFGWFFRAIGGYPVDRSKSTDLVEQAASIIKSHEHFKLAVAPEGTRRKVERLRTGFYYIARAAGIPIIPVGFDYRKREVVIGSPIYPTDVDADMRAIVKFFSAIHGRNPELGISLATEASR